MNACCRTVQQAAAQASPSPPPNDRHLRLLPPSTAAEYDDGEVWLVVLGDQQFQWLPLADGAAPAAPETGAPCGGRHRSTPAPEAESQPASAGGAADAAAQAAAAAAAAVFAAGLRQAPDAASQPASPRGAGGAWAQPEAKLGEAGSRPAMLAEIRQVLRSTPGIAGIDVAAFVAK